MTANRLLRPWSKRRTILEWLDDVSLPDSGRTVARPVLPRPRRRRRVKDELETHLYARLTDLTNLDLRLVCYDLTSTYFETDHGHRDVPLASLRLQPRQAVRPPPDRDRPAGHRRRHPDRPSRLRRQHRRLDHAPRGHGRLPGALRRRAHRPRRRSGPHHRAQPRRGCRRRLRPRARHPAAPRRRRAGGRSTRPANSTSNWVPVKEANSAACEVTFGGALRGGRFTAAPRSRRASATRSSWPAPRTS